MIADATAAIIAGGSGRRLGGASKAFLEVGGRPIVARQLDVLRPLFGSLLVVSPSSPAFRDLGLEVVGDRVGGKGAPGGVHAALEHARTPWVFCLACDMPFVRPEAVTLLASRRAGVEAVVPVRNGFLEPLFAFYSSALRDRFARALEGGCPSLARLLETVNTCRVPEGDLAAVDPGCRSLENVNTPHDLARAEETAWQRDR